MSFGSQFEWKGNYINKRRKGLEHFPDHLPVLLAERAKILTARVHGIPFARVLTFSYFCPCARELTNHLPIPQVLACAHVIPFRTKADFCTKNNTAFGYIYPS